jgi:glycosyltransferase involved in cell wall biosynthesis
MFAIVPAHNKAPRIGAVLSVLTTYPGFKGAIVVDDGSDDGTAEVASRFPVRMVQHTENKGKGAALRSGVEV